MMKWMAAAVFLGAACVPVSDPCASVECGAGSCAILDGSPVCLCDSGFQAEGLTCIDLCASNPCVGWAPGAVCAVIDGQRQCQCGAGYAPAMGGCELIPVCPGQHAEGDAAEPDECAALAPTIASGTFFQHTLAPSGDNDWFRIAVQTGHAYSFSTDGAPMVLEVLTPDGTLVARDGRGVTHAELLFVASRFDFLFVHARGLAPTDTGPYQIRYEDLGPDDYVNSPYHAERVPNGTVFTGRFQYPGDLDVAWVDLAAGSIVQLALGDAGMGDFIIDVAQPDGGSHEFLPGQSALLSPRAEEHLVLTARARFPTGLGGFAMSITTIGVDDYADDPSWAMPLVVGGPNLDGALERDNDVDTFSAPQVIGHLYNARLTASPGVTLSVTDGSGELLTTNAPLLVWQASQAQPVVLRVIGATGRSYSIGIDDLGVDDYAGTLSAATPIPLNTAISGRLELVDDVDAFSFAATPGHSVQIATTPSSVWLELHDAQGALLREGFQVDYYVVSPASLTLVVRRSDTYSPRSLLPYSLSVTDLGLEDHGDSIGSATPATIGTLQAGQIGYLGDADVFAVMGQSGHVYRASITGQTLKFMSLRDATNTFLDGLGAGQLSLAFYQPTTAPLYLVVSGPLGAYTLLIEDLGTDDHSNSVIGATALTLGTQVSGSSQFPRDLDCFTVPVVAGHVYLVTDTSSTMYSDFTVSALDGSQSMTWWSMGTASHTGSFRASSAQAGMLITVHAQVYPVPYTLLVTDEGLDDYGDTLADATPLTVDGAPLAGTLQSSWDRDAFSVPVAAGEVIAVTCTTTQGNACALDLQAPANTGSYWLPGGPSSQTGLGGDSPGVWLVSVSGQDLGSYSVVATHSSDDSTSPRALFPGAPLNGTLDYAGDTDDFNFQLSQGMTISLTLSGPIEAWLYSPRGVVERNIYPGQSMVTPLETGTYRLRIKGVGSSATTTYSVALQ